MPAPAQQRTFSFRTIIVIIFVAVVSIIFGGRFFSGAGRGRNEESTSDGFDFPGCSENELRFVPTCVKAVGDYVAKEIVPFNKHPQAVLTKVKFSNGEEIVGLSKDFADSSLREEAEDFVHQYKKKIDVEIFKEKEHTTEILTKKIANFDSDDDYESMADYISSLIYLSSFSSAPDCAGMASNAAVLLARQPIIIKNNITLKVATFDNVIGGEEPHTLLLVETRNSRGEINQRLRCDTWNREQGQNSLVCDDRQQGKLSKDHPCNVYSATQQARAYMLLQYPSNLADLDKKVPGTSRFFRRQTERLIKKTLKENEKAKKDRESLTRKVLTAKPVAVFRR